MTVCNDRIVFFEVYGGADFFAYNLQRCRWSMTDEKEGAGECSIKGKESRINYFSESISNASCNSSSLPDKTSRRSPASNLSAPVG